MKIFVSYSREDEAIAHLLTYILTSKEIQCLIDRQIPSAQAFDSNLQEMIKEADVILLLLTNSALSSAWVHQEIGFAVAHKKRIWPLAMEKDIKPSGMISTIQSYSMFDWSEPSCTIERLVNTLQGEDVKKVDTYKEFGFDHIVQGKIQRTKFLIDRLREIQRRDDRELVILNQAAFSIFSASDDPLYREAGEHSMEYMKLLLEERQVLCELIDEKRTSFKLMLWPVRAYENKYLTVRYENLLRWMREVKDNQRVDYICAQYPGPNRLIVKGELCLEGFKLHHISGYDMNVVKYQIDKIDAAIQEFDRAFEQAASDKETAIYQIEEMYNKVSQL